MLGWLKRKEIPEHEIASPVPERRWNFSEKEAEKLLESIKEEFGLDYAKQRAVTYRKIERFAMTHEIDSFRSLMAEIRDDRALKNRLINLLTVCETYFFRESEQIGHAGRLVQSGHIQSVLCAPCSSGEEVYSLLLSIRESGRIPALLRVTGIDINTDALDMAEKGCYSARSVSNVSRDLLERFFTKSRNGYCISEDLKRHTRFVRQNVFADDIGRLGKYDAIFSRNMMIYFTDEEKRRALCTFHSLLKPQGVLYLGHADINFTPDGFEKIYENRTTLYRRRP